MAVVKRQVTITSERWGGTIESLKDGIHALSEELDNSGQVLGTPSFTISPAGRNAWSKVRITLRTETSVSAD